MRIWNRQNGFSLTEVLLATGILAIGFVLIAMIFPAGIKLTSMAAEKTLGPAIAEEAAAKMRLAGLDLSRITTANTFYLFPGQRAVSGAQPERHLDPQSEKYLYKKLVLPAFDPADPAADATVNADAVRLYTAIADMFLNQEGIYPSLPVEFYEQNPAQSLRYSWSAVYLRRTPQQDIRAMIFVCRTSGNKPYCGVLYNASTNRYEALQNLKFPVPVPVNVTFTAPDQIEVAAAVDFFDQATCRGFFGAGTDLLDDGNGRIYKVIEKQGNVFRISGDLNSINPTRVWVVPPAVGSQRNPCIGIYEAVLN
jgi:prepilin-type N-terminal cleavage/methylation domain-containing protein